MTEALPCVPADEAVFSFSYEIYGDEYSSLSFAYAIDPSDIEFAELNFGYRIGISTLDRWEPTITPRGYMTQVVGNYFPYWHAARRLYGGRTQRVLNSLGGYHLTEIMNKIRRFRANLFLETADLSEPNKVWVVNRPVARGKQDTPVNLLQNPSFSKVMPQRNGPWGWSSSLINATGDWELKRGLGLYGYYGVEMSVTEGESVTLSQSNLLSFRIGNSYTATVWYAGMRPVRSTPITDRTSGPILLITTRHTDGTTSTDSVFLEDDTAGAWKSATITVTPTKNVHEVEVAVVAQPYESEDVVIQVGGLQLERGSVSTVFSSSITNQHMLYLIYPTEEVTESTAWGDITYTRQKRIMIDDYYDYPGLLDLPPDRCTVSNATSEVGVSSAVLDAYVEPDGQQFSVGWRINSNYIERYNADINQNEVWHTLRVADLFGDGSRERYYYVPADVGVTQTYEALTTADKWIYVLVKETYLGKTQRVLKVCSPHMRWDNENYIESIADIYVDDGTGSATFLGKVQGRSDQLLATIGGTDKVIDLIWDSAARNDNGTIILRNDPGSARLVA